MNKSILHTALILLLFATLITQTLSQTLACKKVAFTALQPIPKLKYKCRAGVNDYEDQVLKFPERLSALRLYLKTLEGLNDGNWWETDVYDLAACDLRGKPGVLTSRENQKFENGEYTFNVLGNNQIRIIIARDPCFQTGFNGANLFLLYRKNGKVYATEIIDGFFTRADSPLGMDFAMNGDERIIEISTTSGGLYPTVTNYYFTINKITNKAQPKTLFKDDDGKLSNQITSMMLLGDSEEYGLPLGLEPLQIIIKNRLAKSFDAFIDNGETFGEENHQKFERKTLHWNGKFYE